MFKRLFGDRTPRGNSDLADRVRQLYPWLVLDAPAAKVAEALPAWAWLKPPRAPVALVSRFGDLFFETADGVVMLDTLEGALRVVASGRDAFLQAIQDETYRDELLSDVWVQAAGRQGLHLDDGECLDWAVPPVLGGECAIETIKKTLLTVKLDVLGQLHRQIQALPPGTPITGVTLG